MKRSMITLINKRLQKLFRHDLERSEWLHQLETFLAEGYSLLEALKIIELYEPKRRKAWLNNIYNSLMNGELFSYQLTVAGYSRDMVSYILFAEKYGNLQLALKTCSDILRKRFELIQKSKAMLYYPIFLLTCLLIITVILGEGILPQYQLFFLTLNTELPFITKLVIHILSIFQLPIFFSFILFIFVFVFWFYKQSREKRITILLKIPLFRYFLKMYCTHYFVIQLSPLLNNDFSLYEALTILKNDSRVPFIQEEASFFLQQLKNGETFSNTVQMRNIYEQQLAVLIALGEAKGNLGKELERYSNFIFEKQYEQLRKLIAIAQPTIYASIGVIVIVLFLSMMMPIFQLMENW